MSSKEIILLEPIENKIHEFRGYKVMLDKDIALLFGVETRRVNEQVKRNMNKFPHNFMFQLTKEENESLMSQNTISKRGGNRKLPYVFTEHGILMVSTLISSPIATQMSIDIMNTFVRMREVISTHKDILLRLEQLENISLIHNEDIRELLGLINTLIQDNIDKNNNPPTERIGFMKD